MLLKLLSGLGLNGTASIIICIILTVIESYLLGSLNCGIIFSRLLYKGDVRTSGSGNAGSTNMLRTYGKKAGFLTFGGDCLKTAIAIGIGFLIFDLMGMFIAGIACMVGHTYPVFFKFKGGKGVACFAILVLITSIAMGRWYLFVILFSMFVIILLGTKYVSLGSIICSLLYPILLNRFTDMAANKVMEAAVKFEKGSAEYNELASQAESILKLHSFELFAILAALFVVFLHRENLKRLFNGTENKTVLFKKKAKKSDE